MDVRRDKHKTPAFLGKAEREQKKIQEKMHLKLKDDIYRLFQDGTYSDITLPCGPTPMLIHKAILESRVPGLVDILCPDGVPNKTILDTIAAEDLRQFIQCVYQEDNLDKAWQIFLSHLTMPDKQEEHGQSAETGPAGDVGQHPGNNKGLEESLLDALGGVGASSASGQQESCQKATTMENVDTTGAAGINDVLDGVPGNQRVPEELECSHAGNVGVAEVQVVQEEGSGNDSQTSPSLPYGGDTDSGNILLTNGMEHAEMLVADHQGSASASSVKVRPLADSIQRLDVCQYVIMDSPMGLVPNPLKQSEKSAADTSQIKAASLGPVCHENMGRMNSEGESEFGKLNDSEAVVVNGFAASVRNGTVEQENIGSECDQNVTKKSLLKGDPTSSTQHLNSDDQTDSERKKPNDPVQNIYVGNSDELHQFVRRVHNLPVPSGTLSENLMCLLDAESSIFSDVALVSSDGTRIPAHRCLLHCRCEFFAAMLGGGWIESESDEIQLRGLSRLVVDAMLQFMYGGTAGLSDDANLRDLLGAADMYGLEGLKEVTAFHLKRDWCHLFHKPLCAECLALVPHCYALCESFGLPEQSQTCLRWMSKNMDRFWVQKTFSNLPPEMLENCSKDVTEILTVKNVIEVLFQLDKIKISLPQGQSSWAEPVKEITSRTRKKVLQFASNNFYKILDGPAFEDKYLKGMGWKKDVMEPLFRRVVAGLSLENADLNFRAIWRLYKMGEMAEEEWNPDAYTAVGVFYDKIYNYVVNNASYIVHTERFKGLPEDLQKQIRKDAVYVDEGLSKTTKKPILSSSQRPKSAQVRRTLSHPLRASSPASSTSSASSTASAPSSSRSRGRGGRAGSGSARGTGGPSRGTGGPARGAGVPPRGAGSRSSRGTGRGGAVGRGAGASARGNGTDRSRSGGVGGAGRDGAQRPARPRDGAPVS